MFFSSEDDPDVSDGEEDSFQECPWVDSGSKRKTKPNKKPKPIRNVRFAPVDDGESEAELPPLSPLPSPASSVPAIAVNFVPVAADSVQPPPDSATPSIVRP